MSLIFILIATKSAEKICHCRDPRYNNLWFLWYFTKIKTCKNRDNEFLFLKLLFKDDLVCRIYLRRLVCPHKKRARRSSLNEDELDSGSLLAPGKPLVKKKSLSLDLRHPDYENFMKNDDICLSLFGTSHLQKSDELDELFGT
jgi:hypothetical protein